MKTPTLETPRLWLRPFVTADAAEVQRLAGERAIADTTLNIPHPYEDGMAEDWIATHEPAFVAGELATFAIAGKAGDQLMGAIGLTFYPQFARAELGYWVGKPFWGNGYCTEAALRILRYGFEERELNRVHASYLARNPASGKVLKKIGMREEGVARQHARKWGVFEDLRSCGLLREEWRRQTASG